MNKYQKAESRKVKAFVQLANECGYPYSYRRVRRMLRKWDRDIKRLPRVVSRTIHKGFAHYKYMATKAGKQISDGLRANATLVDEFEHYHPMGPAPKLPGDPNFVIDETPVEEPTEMWPKENPYLKKETYAENCRN